MSAFAKVGKEVNFPNDFAKILNEKPIRTTDSITTANAAINLDKDQLKYAFFWFISGSAMDDIALQHLQTGNREKAGEIFQKKETFSSLINSAVLAFIDGNVNKGFGSISKVVHNSAYRTELLKSLSLSNLQISEDELTELVLTKLLEEIPAAELLSACSNPTDRAIISKKALEAPISAINSAIEVAQNANAKDAEASLAAGTTLMNTTKEPLKAVKDIAGATSPQYQMIADNLAKQILQCGINYYNNASDSDIESPRKAMVLQSYAMSIAVSKPTKDRCKTNYDILKQAVDNIPPAEVAAEAIEVRKELNKFVKLPDKISHSVTLLNHTKPWLQKIKSKLGASYPFYLSLSTQVVGNALHNVIEEVNQAQNYFSAIIKAVKESGVDPSLLNYLGDEHSPAKIIENKVKPAAREAWKATLLMDSFDMETDFKNNRYLPNRKSLKEMCDSLGISTTAPRQRITKPQVARPGATTTQASKPRTQTPTPDKEGLPVGCWVAIVIAIIIFLISLS